MKPAVHYKYKNSNQCDSNVYINSINDRPLDKLLIPKNFTEALKYPEWVEAINKEIQGFLQNQVFSPATFDKNATMLHTFWIFTRKLNGDVKAELITINPRTVGHCNENSSTTLSFGVCLSNHHLSIISML